MIRRCIMIFPKFENMDIINKIREKYDPLAKHVEPHITLIFPFESDIKTSELSNHISSVVSEISQFEIVLQGVTVVESFGNYLFLRIKNGSKEIIKLHEKLYTSILEPHYPEWLKKESFLPHMTVGLLDSDKEFKTAFEDVKNMNYVFKDIVREISVEIIDENEDSVIELNIALKDKN